MHLSHAGLTAAAVRCEQSLLQHIGEDALALGDKINTGRRRFAGKQASQRLEIFPRKKTRRRDISDHAAGTREAQRQIGEDTVEIGVPVEAPPVFLPKLRGKRDATVRRIAYDKIEAVVFRFTHKTVTNPDDSRKARACSAAKR